MPYPKQPQVEAAYQEAKNHNSKGYEALMRWSRYLLTPENREEQAILDQVMDYLALTKNIFDE
jgi:hypothetical protein